MSRQSPQKPRGRPAGTPMTRETKLKMRDSFEATIAKRKRKPATAPMTKEQVIAKIRESPGIRTTMVTDRRNINRKLITKMAKDKEIIRKVPRTGMGYELYLPEMGKEVLN